MRLTGNRSLMILLDEPPSRQRTVIFSPRIEQQPKEVVPSAAEAQLVMYERHHEVGVYVPTG